MLISNLQIENLSFSQHSHYGIRICKLAILRSKFLSFHSGHCMSTINGYKLLCFFFFLNQTEIFAKTDKEIASRDCDISITFPQIKFLYHSFFFQNTLKKKSFFFFQRHLDFSHLRHLTVLQTLYLGKNGLKLNL